MPTTDNRPRGRPRKAVSGTVDRAIAQVALAVLRFVTQSVQSGPTCAKAAPSATPWQPAMTDAPLAQALLDRRTGWPWREDG